MKPSGLFPAIIGCAMTAILLSISSSCTSNFELDDINATEKPVLYCFPTAGSDTTIIQLSKSIPVTDKGTPVPGIPGADIIFTVNGEPKQVYWNASGTTGVPDMCYYVTSHLSPGDKIDITAQIDGMTVSSGTEVPAPFIINDISLGIKPGIERKLLFKVSFTDSSPTGDYYGLRIVEETAYETGELLPDGKWEVSTEHTAAAVEIDLSDEPLINNKVGLDATFDLDYDFYQELYIWSDETIDGKEYTLRLTAPYHPELEWHDDSSFAKETRQYRVYLYRLAPDLYKFLKSLNDTANNILGQNGLAPIRSNYTNIENGFGVVGGCQLTVSAPLGNP